VGNDSFCSSERLLALLPGLIIFANPHFGLTILLYGFAIYTMLYRNQNETSTFHKKRQLWHVTSQRSGEVPVPARLKTGSVANFFASDHAGG